MAQINSKTNYTFDDLLLAPRPSNVIPSEVDVSTKIGKVELKIPIISAAMDTVTEGPMALAMFRLGGLGVVHRNMKIEEQLSQVNSYWVRPVGVAMSPNDDIEKSVKFFLDNGVATFCVDSAHGASAAVVNAVRRIRKFSTEATIIAGNIATMECAWDLMDAGADALKVGVGPGRICTTRVIAGVGVPQLSAIMEVAEAARCFHHRQKVTVIADGGIRHSGDIVKALAAGAHAVMLGGLLAGTKESPGDVVMGGEFGDESFKSYRGMGSTSAMQLGSKSRYGQANIDNGKLVPEGIEGLVPYKGPVEEVVHQLVGGLRSGMGYVGAQNLDELQRRAIFNVITGSGLAESHPHNMKKIEKSANY
jgi:IMP dehydrogenase